MMRSLCKVMGDVPEVWPFVRTVEGRDSASADQSTPQKCPAAAIKTVQLQEKLQRSHRDHSMDLLVFLFDEIHGLSIAQICLRHI
jgi:hypothetical protein